MGQAKPDIEGFWHIGRRVLYKDQGSLLEGVMQELSPSQKFVKIKTNGISMWHDVAQISVIEDLPYPEPVMTGKQ